MQEVQRNTLSMSFFVHKIHLTQSELFSQKEKMAQKMKGDLLVESIERVGSRFFVIFPLIENKS